MTLFQELTGLARLYLRNARFWRTRNRAHARRCLELAKDYRWQARCLDP